MLKAEEAALLAYPPTHSTGKRDAKRIQSELVDTHQPQRTIFKKDYELAEKDYALTWQDIKTIVEIADKLVEKDVNGQLPEVCETEEGYYKAILEEFNKTRK